MDLPLHICPECHNPRVYVREWLQAPTDGVALDRRCPDCEWTHLGMCEEDELQALDVVLQQADEAVVATLYQALALDVDAFNDEVVPLLGGATE